MNGSIGILNEIIMSWAPLKGDLERALEASSKATKKTPKGFYKDFFEGLGLGLGCIMCYSCMKNYSAKLYC